MTSNKRKTQNKEHQAKYRAKMKVYIVHLLETIEKLKMEINKYKD